jgi:hypothetical protein
MFHRKMLKNYLNQMMYETMFMKLISMMTLSKLTLMIIMMIWIILTMLNLD